MGTTHVSPEEVIEMQKLYPVYGTYAGVSRNLTRYRSPSTVAKFIKMEDVPRSLRIAVEKLLQKG